jgi:hypothetical protein
MMLVSIVIFFSIASATFVATEPTPKPTAVNQETTQDSK